MALSVTIRVLFFGLLKDIAGLREEHLLLDEGVRLNDLFGQYAARFPKIRDMRASIVLAVNQQFALDNPELRDGDEVAFLPPVSGGSDRYSHVIEDQMGHFFALTREPIDTASLRRRLLQGSDGGIVLFEGVVRNNSDGRRTLYLDYECYEAMAIRVMADLGREIASRHEVGRLAMVHRLGRMEIGEASVVILVCAPHRKPAFDAALEAINRLKKLVPVWKREYFEDGAVWVEGDWDSSVVGH
ncbi:molybdenum cofactor biosynthesis protein MoaE [uncultured Paludibaculum sp.]|uniref:molybdenum cofactor biosynthesis protein MoaE n=1 Tax=uncultured Paludibaculum sp. TaxID=1765020 RepID=UPI002AAC19E8|nr:molybdenum cofactor biosynthesis protein MoaE [uncultured Paludibaculum sp.]